MKGHVPFEALPLPIIAEWQRAPAMRRQAQHPDPRALRGSSVKQPSEPAACAPPSSALS